MALPNVVFGDASFPSIAQYDYLVPLVGGTLAQRQPLNPNDPVQVQLSDGRLVTVFSSSYVAARCLEKMRQANQSFLIASDDIFVVSISHSKLLICEASLYNQRLQTSFVPFYTNGLTRFVHRSLSSVMTLGQALSSVGFAALGGQQLQNNVDLRGSQTSMVLWDYRWTASPTASSPGTLVDDTEQTEIRYNWRTLTRGQAPVIPAVGADI